MSYLLGYCDITFADTVNSSSEWTSASDDEKNLAITYGRLYIDQTYTCEDSEWDTSDYSTIPYEVQRANAILAEQYVLGELIQNPEDINSGPVTKDRVKAGSVEVETTYMASQSKYIKFVDQKPEITMLLSQVCSIGSSNSDLIRV